MIKISSDLSSVSFGFEDVRKRLSRGKAISQEERERYEDHLEPIEDILVKTEDGYETAFDISYLDKPDLTEEEDQLNYLAGESLGINDAYKNALLEDKGEAHILAIGEPALDTKLSSEYAWDGLAWKLEQLRENEGEEYFEEDKFATAFSGSLYGRHPLFFSITNDDEMELLGYSKEEFEDEIDEVKSALEEDTIEAIIEERVTADIDSEEFTATIRDMMEEEIDKEELASKIVTYTQSRNEIERKLGKISDAIGREVPLHLADGEEGRENMKEIKETAIENYKEEVEQKAERVDETIDNIYDKIDELRSTLEETEADYSDSAEEIASQLQDYDYEDILEAEFEELFDEVEGINGDIRDKIEELRSLEKERDRYLDDLESLKYDSELDKKAKSVEQSVNEALGPSAARILSRRHITADWNEILNEAVDAQYKALHESINNIELKSYVMDGGLTEFQLDGYDIQLAHNLNPLSDVTLKYGQTRNLENRGQLTDDSPDLFISGHHGEGRLIFNKEERGIEALPWSALQLGTFQDADKVKELMQEGVSDSWHIKRYERGQFDNAIFMMELGVKEVNGKKFVNPKIRPWFHSDLQNIGKQIEAEEFLEEVEEERLNEFIAENVEYGEEFDYADFAERFAEEFDIEDQGVIEGFVKTQILDRNYKDRQEHSITVLGDQQIGAPHDGRFWHQMTTEELLECSMEDLENRAEGNHTVMNLGDTLQGYNIYRGQHTESRGWRGSAELGEKMDEVKERLESAGADPETINQAMKEVAVLNSLQNPESDISHQNLKAKMQMDEDLERMLEDEKLDMLYEFSGNHGNENSKHNNDDEATWRASNFDRELLEEGKVKNIRGTDASRGFIRIGDKNFRVSHDTNGRGKTKADSMLTEENPSNISGSYSGDDHQGAVATKGKTEDDSKSFKANPAMQPMNDLTDIILSGDTVQGILIEDVIDEREYVHSGETEFLLI